MSTPETTQQLPTTQKAWRAVRRGTPAKALSFDDIPVPTALKPGEVLVRVQAAALNPVGTKITKLAPNLLVKRPHVAEFDLAGVVVDGNGTEFKAGDEVFGGFNVPLTLSTGQGALAQYTRIPAKEIWHRPANITPTEAAGLKIAALTAQQALFAMGKLEADQWVFVNGGSTSVGAFAIQMAKAVGAKVAASASAKNEAFVRGLGADEFFDYTTGPLHETLKARAPSPKYHLFLEAVGIFDPALFVHSGPYLAPGAKFLSVGPQPTSFNPFSIMGLAWNAWLRPGFLGGARAKYTLITLRGTQDDLKRLSQFITEGKVRPLIDSTYEFADALKAFERLSTNRAVGKVVVKVDPTTT